MFLCFGLRGLLPATDDEVGKRARYEAFRQTLDRPEKTADPERPRRSDRDRERDIDD